MFFVSKKLIKMGLMPLVVVLVLGLSHNAHASFLRILDNPTVVVNSEHREVVVTFVLNNDGDEVARDVGVSFPLVNESRVAASELAPSAKATVEFPFNFDRLGLSGEGRFIVPYHVTYRDTNLYSFSSARFLSIDLASVPAQSLLIKLSDGVERGLSLSDTLNSIFLISNTTRSPIRITKVTVHSPLEILSSTGNLEVPFDLPYGEPVSIAFNLGRANALIGSTYALAIIVEGINDGKHFAETHPISVNIVNSGISSRSLFKWLVIGLGCALVLRFVYSAWVKRSAIGQ